MAFTDADHRFSITRFSITNTNFKCDKEVLGHQGAPGKSASLAPTCTYTLNRCCCCSRRGLAAAPHAPASAASM